jgi:hypothetical protein
VTLGQQLVGRLGNFVLMVDGKGVVNQKPKVKVAYQLNSNEKNANSEAQLLQRSKTTQQQKSL